MMPWLKLDPAWMPPGTQVGPWKVLGFHGGDSFGAVFRAVLTRRPHGGLVALKLAYSLADARFQREAELLSCIEHPIAVSVRRAPFPRHRNGARRADTEIRLECGSTQAGRGP